MDAKISTLKPTDNSRLMLDTLDMIRQLPPDKQEMVLMQVFGMATMALMAWQQIRARCWRYG